MSHYRNRIEICGGIASGKTSLAQLLSTVDIYPVFELFQSNPFWESFYSEPQKYNFETEVTFMLQHYHQIKKQCTENRIMVCDYSFFLDMAYAEIGLHGSQLETFKTVYNEIKNELPPPALVIYLQCDAKTELNRIKNRGRSVENSINADFLGSLNSSIEFQINMAKPYSNIISINSSRMNFVDDELVKTELLKQIARTLNIPSKMQ